MLSLSSDITATGIYGYNRSCSVLGIDIIRMCVCVYIYIYIYIMCVCVCVFFKYGFIACPITVVILQAIHN